MAEKIRLYLEHPLPGEQTVPLSRDQAHYLFGVMRRGVGDRLFVFNGRDGEWRAEITEAGKRAGTLMVLERSRPQQDPPDLWLVFAPIKKARTDFIVEKAAELGAARIVPMRTKFTNADRIRRERLQAHAVEAAEQCGGTYVPEVAELAAFDAVLNSWSDDRQLVFCDESLSGSASGGSGGLRPGAAGIVIGPEGGFSDAERRRLRAHPQAVSISLGPRILRADTAAAAAITLWQNAVGDW